MPTLNKVVEDQWKTEVKGLLETISNHNFSRRLIDPSKVAYWKNPPKHQISSLLNHWFFSIDTREWDGRIARDIRVGEYEIRYISSDPCTIISVPDEENIHLRFHPNEHTHKGDERLPSRDFLLSSYPWENIFMASTLIENKKTWAKTIRNSVDQEIILKSQESFNCDFEVDIAYFGIAEDASAGFREIISYADFELLFGDNSRLSTALSERGFSGLTYKLVQKSKASINNSLFNKTKPRTFIIFIDSLDISILKNSSYQKGLSAIPKIVNNSIVYKNFTASGDWTYPCLFSMHTGTNPQFNFSNFRHDPIFRFLDQERLNSMKHNMATFYITRSLFLSGTKLNSKNFLTRKIAEAGFSQAGIKSSRNHGWRCGLTHSLDVSFENCSIAEIPKHLNHLTKRGSESNIDTFFIDIDCMHRNDMFQRPHGQHWNVDHFEWTQETPDKYERLLGIYQDADIEQRRYKDKLITADKILCSILEEANPEDNILVFSDHGTQYLPWTLESPYSRDMDSTLSPERIWKPTLLVYAPTNSSFNGHQNSEELVSTSDLYNIILALHNIAIEDSNNQSILPKSLGGKLGREMATTFGLTVEANQEHPELSLPNRFELVVRRGKNVGEIHKCPALPLIESNSLEELNHKMFPALY